MPKKIVDLSDAAPVPAPWDLAPEEEAAIIAQYMAGRTLEALEEDYRDFEKQVAEGVPAEELLKQLKEDTSTE
jgi:hypothetical protein